MVELDRERLAGALRITRRGQHLLTAQAARQIGISEATLCRIEIGKHDPLSSTFLAVCNWIDRDPRDFALQREAVA